MNIGSKKKVWGLHFPGSSSVEECSYISRQQGERESALAGGLGPGRLPAVLGLAADARGGQLSHTCPRGRWWPTGDLRVVLQCVCSPANQVFSSASLTKGAKSITSKDISLCSFPLCLYSSDYDNFHLCQSVPPPVQHRESVKLPWTWQLWGSLKHMPACLLCFLFPTPHAEYIQKYATEEALKEQEEGTGDSSSESSMSDFSEDEAQDMEL